MSKSPLRKQLKPPPWIPPGKYAHRTRRTTHQPHSTIKQHENGSDTFPKKVLDSQITENLQQKEDEPVDLMSLSSNSSHEGHEEPNLNLFPVYREMKLLYTHFASLKTAFLSTHRLMDSQNIEDNSIKEMLNKAAVDVKEINESFDDLEFSVSILENTLDETAKTEEYLKLAKCKEILLSRLLKMYEKVIVVYQIAFEKQDFKELYHQQDSLSSRLKVSEKKNLSQGAVITDLERRLSIYQSKANAMESYKSSLENAKKDLEKQLVQKEAQVKYLSDELLSLSGKQIRSDHEELLEIIEGIKLKAYTEKSALKKAVKFQKEKLKEHEKKCLKIIEESNEKDKMLSDIASQRDHLKVQLTVVNNSIIQLKNQIEEMKIQNQKLQKEVDEQELSSKKEFNQLKFDLEEKAALLENTLRTKKNLEDSLKELEDQIETFKKQIRSLKGEATGTKTIESPKFVNSDRVYEEMNKLVNLLQSTKNLFENNLSSHIVHAGGDHLPASGSTIFSIQNEILEAVQEAKRHLLDLKAMYEENGAGQKNIYSAKKQNDKEKQSMKLEVLYGESIKENEALKSEIEKLKSSNVSDLNAQKSENCFTASMPSDNFSRKLQLELLKKSDEILKMKCEFQKRERDLEHQLREFRDKVKTLEIDTFKMSGLEEELKARKLELSLLQQKKDEETSKLLQQTKELQDSLDIRNAETESLQRYVQLLKSSYFNVFGDS